MTIEADEGQRPAPEADFTLRQYQEMVDEWIRTIGVRYYSELTNTAVLMEEVGEVARLIARLYGEQSFKESEPQVDLGDEMADVLFVLVCLANQTGVDLTAAVRRNLQKKTQRDRERHQGNAKLRDLPS
jgi:NTP pyrophosphatase (non-canonical NTP hydrolase)